MDFVSDNKVGSYKQQIIVSAFLIQFAKQSFDGEVESINIQC
jgi:hypothetical protein